MTHPLKELRERPDETVVDPSPVDRTRHWLLVTVGALAALAIVHLALGGSWVGAAIYPALFLPVIVLVYLDLRRKRESAPPPEESLLSRAQARAEVARWRHWSIPVVVAAAVVGGVLGGAKPSLIPFLVILGLLLVAIRGVFGWLFDRAL